tara:strand:- start:150 stop:371 length:222 start_codon:yes stop_codon:yes gene_type:complete
MNYVVIWIGNDGALGRTLNVGPALEDAVAAAIMLCEENKVDLSPNEIERLVSVHGIIELDDAAIHIGGLEDYE